MAWSDPLDAEQIVRAFRFVRIRFASEDDLQEAVETVLKSIGAEFKREHRLSPKDRIDFLVDGGVGIEIKVDGSTVDLMRQVIRYLAHDAVKEMVVVTTRAPHRELPYEVGGKKVRVVHLMASAL